MGEGRGVKRLEKKIPWQRKQKSIFSHFSRKRQVVQNGGFSIISCVCQSLRQPLAVRNTVGLWPWYKYYKVQCMKDRLDLLCIMQICLCVENAASVQRRWRQPCPIFRGGKGLIFFPFQAIHNNGGIFRIVTLSCCNSCQEWGTFWNQGNKGYKWRGWGG